MDSKQPETVAVGSGRLVSPSGTPRTDAKAVLCNYGAYLVPSDFARELERENNALRDCLTQWREWWETPSVGGGQKGPIYTATVALLANVNGEPRASDQGRSP